MPDNFFTLMIIPKRKSAVKKLTLSRSLVRGLFIGSVFAVLLTLYIVYDYASIKRDKIELARLRTQTKEQSQQIKDLSLKVDQFADRMERLQQFDKKIRILANYQTGRDKKLPLGIGGASSENPRLKEMLNSDHEVLIAETQKGISNLNYDADLREKSFNELLSFLREQKSILASTPLIWPVKGWVTSEFGYRESPFSSGTEFHKGLDIATRMGKEVVATADGLIVEASYLSDEGNTVKIDHGRGLASSYSHLSKIAVKQGARVKRGDLIGLVGDSGRSTGSHLHYAVYNNKIPVNPRKYLK
ncbi:MAG: peptidase M23 [Deltaproteobacteria bacterium HGW-Deltaproteobacteria-12]|jgi:murein DD-endopeptidase MepM/ murein hydrolase activator NlpD|nr:MAG: peptidase M23 [Deltaproteobacteria bacterium HGW-Deltaproteobacteria-12]